MYTWENKRNNMISEMFTTYVDFDLIDGEIIFHFGSYEIKCGYENFRIIGEYVQEFNYDDLYSFSYKTPYINFEIGHGVNNTKKYGFSKGE